MIQADAPADGKRSLDKIGSGSLSSFSNRDRNMT